MTAIQSLFSTLPAFSANGLRGLRPRETAAAFAHSVISRASGQTAVQPVPEVKKITAGDIAAASTGKTEGANNAPQVAARNDKPAASAEDRAAALETALADTVGYVADKFGDKAGTAMMGLMAKSLGNEKVTEESMGSALMQVIKFVDTQFGIKDGDEFIKHLNGALNENINAFFANGRNEEFVAVTTPLGAGEAAAGAYAAAHKGAYAPDADAKAEGLSPADAVLDMINTFSSKRKIKPNAPKNPYLDSAKFNPPAGSLVDAAA